LTFPALKKGLKWTCSARMLPLDPWPSLCWHQTPSKDFLSKVHSKNLNWFKAFNLRLYCNLTGSDNTIVQGPHLRTPNPGFNPGFTPRIFYIKGGVNPLLNPGFGVLRFGLCILSRIYYELKSNQNKTGHYTWLYYSYINPNPALYSTVVILTLILHYT
jgi:hypothetical protein